MKRLMLVIMAALLAGCTPALDRRLMEEGAREFQLSYLVETPEAFKDKLFILGGVIAETRLVEKGSQIEALFVPVNAYGDLQDLERAQGRFLAVYPRARGLLDPLIYSKGRLVTLAGTFIEVRKGKIDELEYFYPVFEVRQVHLWEEYSQYPYGYEWGSPYYYPSYYRYYRMPYSYDPWYYRPYPGPYWPPPPW